MIILKRLYPDSLLKTGENSFIRNSLVLTIGTGISQLIPIAFSPLLTRLFSPAEFGLFAVLSSITAIISVISTGKYENAIILAKDDKTAVSLIKLSLFLSVSFSFLSILILLIISNPLVVILKQPNLRYWIYLSPVISLMISFYLCYNEWCIRKSLFRDLAVNKVVNSASITISNTFFGLIRVPVGGLILGELSGRFITAVVCISRWIKRNLQDFIDTSAISMYHAAKRFIDCPKYILPGQMLNTLGMQLIVLLISGFFGDKEVGYYSITSMVMYVPISVISSAIRDVFKQRANDDYKRDGNCYQIFRKTTLTISLLSFVIFGLLFIVLPGLFDFAFGSDWRIAGIYARILCPMVFISFISESVFGVLYAAEKMKTIFWWQVTYLVVNISSLLLGYYFFKDIKLTLICFAVGKSFVHLISFYLAYLSAKGNLD